ncbi:MAG: NADP-dependent malic enzyme [Alphaproteobacteria bacterium]
MDDLDKEALYYHQMYPPGKLTIQATKPMANQRDLSLAYSPGVAAPCLEIEKDPSKAALYTARANLVGVVTNGTAVLGLGNIGALASKPVMEGKAVLFKKFANVDVFDIEVAETDVDAFVECVKRLEPTFGGINLEDIGAPACFEIERRLREEMNIPVFHDDQHGTAIIAAAAVYNALELKGKTFDEIKIVVSGAGAAALACVAMMVSMGAQKKNIYICDRKGVVQDKREDNIDEYKSVYMQTCDERTLDDAIAGADVFLGLSGPGALKQDMVKKMADKPVILALANPTPEILPTEAHEVRPDAIVCTGRSDFPNQVNNVLCFPFIFRGALDVGASTINEEMKIACVKAIANLAKKEVSEIVARAYGDLAAQGFNENNLIPKPFDPRLITEIAPAVARAAMDSGVASRPIEDFDAYIRELNRFVYKSGTVMKPMFDKAQEDPKRVVYCEGEDERVLRAVQFVVDDGLAKPILIGRRAVVEMRIEKLGLRLKMDKDFELCDPENDDRYSQYRDAYHQMNSRGGISKAHAGEIIRTRPTAIGALMLKRGEADAMLCGATGGFQNHCKYVKSIVGMRPGIRDLSAMSMMILDTGVYFLADTHVTNEPTSEQLAEMAVLASDEAKRFGIETEIAFISHSNFGSSDRPSAKRVRDAVAILHRDHPELKVDGEMHADAALTPLLRESLVADCKIKGPANLLIMPNLDAANIAYNLLKTLANGLSVGPMLIGAELPAHIMTTSVTVRGIVNMSAVAVVDAQMHATAKAAAAAE